MCIEHPVYSVIRLLLILLESKYYYYYYYLKLFYYLCIGEGEHSFQRHIRCV